MKGISHNDFHKIKIHFYFNRKQTYLKLFKQKKIVSKYQERHGIQGVPKNAS